MTHTTPSEISKQNERNVIETNLRERKYTEAKELLEKSPFFKDEDFQKMYNILITFLDYQQEGADVKAESFENILDVYQEFVHMFDPLIAAAVNKFVNQDNPATATTLRAYLEIAQVSTVIDNVPKVAETINQYFKSLLEGKITDEKVKLCAELQKSRIVEKGNPNVIAVINKYVEGLISEQNYDDAMSILQWITKKDIFGREHKNPFWEWGVIVLLKTGTLTLSDDNYYIIRRLLRIEAAGRRTHITDFILETEEYKQYISFLASIPKDYEYDEDEEKLSFNRDLIWYGNFIGEDIDLYFPEVGEISTFEVKGNFTVNGALDNIDRNFGENLISGSWFDYRIKGDLSADYIAIYASDTRVGGNLYAKRYIHLDMIDDDDKAEFKKQITTPLLIIQRMDLRHKGSISDNCLVITSSSDSAKHINSKNIHYIPNLAEDVITRKYGFPRVLIDELLEKFEKGESIFKEGYKPEEKKENKAALKLVPVAELFTQNKWNEISKILKSITNGDIDNDISVELEIKYYKTYILYQQDEEKNSKKIEKACKEILKTANDLPQPPQWDILLFASAYLADNFEAEGGYKKALDLISKYNKGDKDYYERKIRLLLQTGKEKAALLPAYIAISEYKSEELKELAESEAYQKFEKQVQQPFTVPKGFKTTYQSALSRLLDVAGFAFDEEENIIVYKGDVLWDSDLYAVEDISEYFGVEASDIVILGDLYVMGRIHLHHISLYVQGNIFASDIYMGDATLECTGNVFADEEIVMSEDIGGTSAYIYGNVKTPVFVAAPEELQIYGTVHPETVCIGLKNYEFDGIKISKFHSGEELSRNIDTNSAYDQDFHYRLQTGTLFKK